MANEDAFEKKYEILVNPINICPWLISSDVGFHNPGLLLKADPKLAIRDFFDKSELRKRTLETLLLSVDGFEVSAEFLFYSRKGDGYLLDRKKVNRVHEKYTINGKNSIKVIHAPYENENYGSYSFNLFNYCSNDFRMGAARFRLSEFLYLMEKFSSDLVLHLGRVGKQSKIKDEDMINMAKLILETIEKRPKKQDGTICKIFIENMPYDNNYDYFCQYLGKKDKTMTNVSLPLFLDVLKKEFKEQKGIKEKEDCDEFNLYFGVCFDTSHALSVVPSDETHHDIQRVGKFAEDYLKKDILYFHLSGNDTATQKRMAAGKRIVHFEEFVPFFIDRHIPISKFISGKGDPDVRKDYNDVIRKMINSAIDRNIALGQVDQKNHIARINLETHLKSYLGLGINPNGLDYSKDIFDDVSYVRKLLS